ncbi:MAG: U32 family peptidase [Firmicutes bacterium]|nr:U32 family peptidase [Bacillota bacterium]
MVNISKDKKRKEPFLPEILAPVGNDDMARAAFAAGADAIYLAGLSFGARAYAQNFTEEGLKATIRTAHLSGIKVYVTVNTALKEEEVDRAFGLLVDLYELGADAIIIQDPGLIALARVLLPDLPLHGSTQLSVNALSGARLARQRGLDRLVMGREMTKEEVALVLEETDLEVEVFVHGSLCVAQSGQCLLSSFAGGRSGNRGRCAQPCRKTYLLKRGDGRVLGPGDSYLSPRDLMTLDRVETYRDMGVHSLKIEGRMKKPEYVYAAVRAYREALRGKNPDPAPLALMTNRPFTPGYFFGDFGRRVAYPKDDPNGIYLGKMDRKGDTPFFRPKRDLHEGDQIRVEGSRSTFPLSLTEEIRQGQALFFPDYPDLVEGAPVYAIYTGLVRSALEEDLKEGGPEKIPLNIDLSFRVGRPLTASFTGGGRTIRLEGDRVDPAKNRPLSREDLAKSLAKLGNTPFILDDLRIDMEGEGFLPMGAINAFRRKGVDLLLGEMTSPSRPDLDRSTLRKRLALLKEDRDRASWPLDEGDGTSLYFWTNQGPSSYSSSEKEGMDILITEVPDLVSDWTEAGKEVFLVIPELLESRHFQDFLDRAGEALKIAQGVYLPTINEWGRVGDLPEDQDLILGFGLQVFNAWAAHALRKEGETLLGEGAFLHRVRAVIPSTELTAEEYEGLFTYPMPWLLPVYGRLTGMVLRHCPASTIKGCRNDRDCETCPFRKDLYLEDDFGARELIRTGRFSRLLLPDLMDLRIKPDLVQGLTSRFLVIDRGEGEAGSVAAQWKNGNLYSPKGPGQKGGQHFPRGLGHYTMKME